MSNRSAPVLAKRFGNNPLCMSELSFAESSAVQTVLERPYRRTKARLIRSEWPAALAQARYAFSNVAADDDSDVNIAANPPRNGRRTFSHKNQSGANSAPASQTARFLELCSGGSGVVSTEGTMRLPYSGLSLQRSLANNVNFQAPQLRLQPMIEVLRVSGGVVTADFIRATLDVATDTSVHRIDFLDDAGNSRSYPIMPLWAGIQTPASLSISATEAAFAVPDVNVSISQRGWFEATFLNVFVRGSTWANPGQLRSDQTLVVVVLLGQDGF
jgi:hypothetical protein